MDDETNLEDLLKLNLHLYEEEVKNIVDKAVKETSMEKVLKELDVTWAAMEFDHDHHPRTNITLLRASEEVVETLEDNQVGGLVLLVAVVILDSRLYSSAHLRHKKKKNK